MKRKIQIHNRYGLGSRTLTDCVSFNMTGTRYGGNVSANMVLANADADALRGMDYQTKEVWLYYDDDTIWGVFDISNVTLHPDGTVTAYMTGISQRLKRCYLADEVTLTDTTAQAVVEYIVDNAEPTPLSMRVFYSETTNGGTDISIPSITLGGRSSVYDLMTQVAQFGDLYWEVGRTYRGSSVDEEHRYLNLDTVGDPGDAEGEITVIARPGEVDAAATVDLEIDETPDQVYNRIKFIGQPTRRGGPYVNIQDDALSPVDEVRQVVIRSDTINTETAAATLASYLFSRFRTMNRVYRWKWVKHPRAIMAYSTLAKIYDADGVYYGRHQVERWDCSVDYDRLVCSCHAGAPPRDDTTFLDNYIANLVASTVNPRHGLEGNVLRDRLLDLWEVVSVDGSTVTVKLADDPNTPPATKTYTNTGDNAWMDPAVGRRFIGARVFTDDEEVDFEVVGIERPSIDDEFVEGGKLSDIIRIVSGVAQVRVDAPVGDGSGAGSFEDVFDMVPDGDAIGIREDAVVTDGTLVGNLDDVLQLGTLSAGNNGLGIINGAFVQGSTSTDWAILSTFFEVVDISGAKKLAMHYNAYVNGTTDAPINLYYDSVDAAYNSVHSQIADTSST